jgi:hypothetical protein
MENFDIIQNRNMNIILNDTYRSFINFFNLKEILREPQIFFPSSKYDIKTNKYAIIRFGLYSSLCIGILTNNWKLVIMILVLIVIIGLILSEADLIKQKEIAKKNLTIPPNCKKSTHNNPMGNVLLYTDIDDANKNLCPNQNNLIDTNLKHNIYYDSKDLFHKKNNTRPFITMPSQTHPNNIDEYKNFLYNFNNPTCKTDGIDCMYNEDLRYHKTYFINDS